MKSRSDAKKRRYALYTIITVALIAAPALVLATYVSMLVKPYLDELDGVLIRTPFLERQPYYYVYDSEIGHIHRPNVRFAIPWPEHPTGRIVMRTNNLGFREIQDTEKEKPDSTIRILVTGDSHIDGVVSNSESFPNQLEVLLNAAGRSMRYEVENGGTGYYGPQHYRRFARKYAYLDPDAFVVVINSGNDFLDALRIEHQWDPAIATGRDCSTLTRMVYFGRLAIARRICHGAVGGMLNQAFYFKHFPKMKRKSLAIVKREIRGIQNMCLHTGTSLCIVILPTPLSAGRNNLGWLLRLSSLALLLGERDLAVTQALSDSIASWLDANRINYLNLAGNRVIPADRELFWKEDCHLNVFGHRLVADLVCESFGGSLEARSRTK